MERTSRGRISGFADSLLLGFPAGNAGRSMSSASPPRHKVATSAAESQTSELLTRCGRGDAKAFRKLYDTTSGRLYGSALRITRGEVLASDAVHDAMLEVWRNADRYDPNRGNADAWLVSLVRYRAVDIVRKRGREIAGVETPEQIDEAPDAFCRLVTTAEGIALRTCLEKVALSQRRLVLLSFVEGLTHREIAARMGQPLGTVKSSIRRTLLALRACLEAGHGSPVVSGTADASMLLAAENAFGDSPCRHAGKPRRQPRVTGLAGEAALTRSVNSFAGPVQAAHGTASMHACREQTRMIDGMEG